MQILFRSACSGLLLATAALAADEQYPKSVPGPEGAARPVYKRYEVEARDHAKLVFHEWAPPDSHPGEPVMLFIHGMGMHGRPYGVLAPALTSRGMTIVAMDLRGHGLSDGKRGDLAKPQVLRGDIGAVIDRLKSLHAGAPIVLAGESMGALIAADYVWQGEKPIAALVLLAPAFGVDRTQLGNLRFRDLLVIPVASPERIGSTARDPQFIKARLADEIALHEVSPGYVLTIRALQREWPAAARDLHLPVYVAVAGEDHVVDNAASKAFYDELGTAKDDKLWHKWDGAYHTMSWDPVTPALMQEVAAWVLKHVK
jgi:alpha-beta hydrolase superfamily lysophospholipase